MKTEKPECLTDAMLHYLDKNGTQHLSADKARLLQAFPLSDYEAAACVLYWMATYTKRHKNDAEVR